jgi:hypothetical protein
MVPAVTIAFLTCVERGRLESETLLLVESLRRWGGGLSDAPVYSFAPRPGQHPAAGTVARLGELGVQHVDEPLNERHPELPNCNKVYACEWAERELDHDVLVFVDSDTVFLAEPTDLAAPGDWLVATRPVSNRNVGSGGEGDKNERSWQEVYEALGVTARPWVETALGGHRIRAYYNTGLIATRREAAVYGRWRDALDRLLDGGFRLRKMRGQTDQVVFAAAVADLADRVTILPDSYNYPIAKRYKMSPAVAALGLDDLTHIHLHRWAHKPGLLEALDPPLDAASERYRWLESRLPIEPIIEDPFPFAKARATRNPV